MRLIQTLADGGHIIHKQAHFVVKAPRPLGNLLRVTTLVLIAPQIGDSAQGYQQRRRANQHNIILQRLADELRLAIDGQQERRLNGNKHQHIVERAQARQLLIILASQQANMVSHRGKVFLQRDFAGVVVFGVEIALIGDQGHFGVDHHVLTLRQAHDNVRLHPRAVVGLNTDLSLVLIAFAQAGGLQHAG